MKKRFFSGFFGVSLALLFASCVSNDVDSLDTKQEADVMFGFDISDVMSKASASADDDVAGLIKCLTLEQLKDKAEAGDLIAEFIVTKTETEEINLDDAQTESINVVGDRLVADPIPIATGTVYLRQFLVKEKTGTDANGNPILSEPLFSAVSNEGEPEPEASLVAAVGVDALLPLDIEVLESDIATKKPVDLSVVCTEKRTASDFGFKMWDIKFLHFHSISFVVDGFEDDPTEEVTGPIIETGTMYIHKAGDATTEKNTNPSEFFGEELDKIPFTSGAFSKLWFADDKKKTDNTEFFGYRIYIPRTGKHYAGSRSVQDLWDYKNSNAWMSNENCLDFDIHKNKTWFLKEVTDVPEAWKAKESE